jgi:hypothetical protein
LKFKWLIFFITFTIAVDLRGQNIIGLDMLGNQKSYDIPFELIQGHIIVDVTIGGLLPLKFIFDTGAQHTVLFESSYAIIMGYKPERQIPIMGADMSSEMMAGIFRNVSMKLGPSKSVLRDIIVLDENFLKLENLLGVNVVGMIGSDYFRNLIVKIDYEKYKITVYDIRTANESKLVNGYTEISSKFSDGKVYVTADVQISESVQSLKLLMDTGASLPLLINTGTDTLLKVPEKSFSTILGYGLSGPVMGYLGKINSFENEVFNHKNMVTYFQDDEYSIIGNVKDIRNGLIGNLTLSKYHLIINYFNQKLYLKPNKYYKKPTKFDLSGLSIQAFGKNFNQFIVKAMINGGPGEKAGILVDDEIVKIGRWSSWRFNLGQVTEKLSSKEGNVIKLKVKRGNKIIPIVLTLENYLN